MKQNGYCASNAVIDYQHFTLMKTAIIAPGIPTTKREEFWLFFYLFIIISAARLDAPDVPKR